MTKNTFAISTGKSGLGDDIEAHTADCSDIKKCRKVSTFTGETMAEAVIAVDTAAAGWFGEEPYTEGAELADCWNLAAFNIKPCLAKALKEAGVTPRWNKTPVVAEEEKTPRQGDTEMTNFTKTAQGYLFTIEGTQYIAIKNEGGFSGRAWEARLTDGNGAALDIIEDNLATRKEAVEVATQHMRWTRMSSSPSEHGTDVESLGTVKVNLNATLEIDLDAYAREYGDAKTAKEMRSDLQGAMNLLCEAGVLFAANGIAKVVKEY